MRNLTHKKGEKMGSKMETKYFHVVNDYSYEREINEKIIIKNLKEVTEIVASVKVEKGIRIFTNFYYEINGDLYFASILEIKM